MKEMLITLSMGPEGEIYANEGRVGIDGTEGNLLFAISTCVFRDLDLFDETRLNFSYDGDADRVAHLVIWMLEDRGLEPEMKHNLTAAVKLICEPGASLGTWPTVKVAWRDLTEVELQHAETMYDGTITSTGAKISMRQLWDLGLVTVEEIINFSK